MNEQITHMEGSICPVPLSHSKQIVMGHGSGGKMSLDLIKQIFLPPFHNPYLAAGNDAAVVKFPPVDKLINGNNLRIAISTDSHVVWPLFFQGGDIGKLAICGTVNDIAMMGAEPLYITAGFILEEGLEITLLKSVIESMRNVAEEAGVQIIAGDTKVVQKGKADGLYINTAGFGIVSGDIAISGANAKPGNTVIISGAIGEHGIAVLEARNDLGFVSGIRSDIAPLNHMVKSMLSVSKNIHVLRDPTRGGLATTLNEIALQSQVAIEIDEELIPVDPAVQAACEMLGFDPLYVANEGKLVAIVDEIEAQLVLMTMRNSPFGEQAAIIGHVMQEPKGRVLTRTAIGSRRILDIPSGELLPRIC